MLCWTNKKGLTDSGIKKNHRMPQARSDFKDHPVPPHTCHRQSCHPPDQAAQIPSQSGLECPQRWRIHNISGQRAPILCHVKVKGTLGCCVQEVVKFRTQRGGSRIPVVSSVTGKGGSFLPLSGRSKD